MPATSSAHPSLATTLPGEIGTAVSIEGQHYLNPPEFRASHGLDILDRGGRIVESADVIAICVEADGVSLLDRGGSSGACHSQTSCARWGGGV